MGKLGDNLRRYRMQCGYTPRRLAELCEMERDTVKAIEAGDIVPEPETVETLAEAVRVRPERIYGLERLSDKGGIHTRLDKDKKTSTLYVEWGKDMELTDCVMYLSDNGIALTFKETEEE